MATPERIKYYRIKRKIGAGGMATVFEAIDTRNQGRVALKVLHPHLADQPAYVARFQREAQMAMTLHSPHIVQILEYGDDRGLHYLAMEYVSGVTLQQFIQQMGALGVNQALNIIYQAALALEEANRHHIVHRDVKPHNIMILPNGMIKVMDFGIARDVMMDSMTMTGMFVGTPQYSSPEQAGGERVDIRSDIYSLGVVLYQLLTGTAPFQADTPQALLMRVMQGNPVPVQSIRIDLPAPVVRLVDKMLAREPERRFQNPSELLAALVALTGNVPQEDARSEMATMVAPLVARTPPPPPDDKRSRRTVYAVGFVAVAAVLTALVVVLWRPWRIVSQGATPALTPTTAAASVGATPTLLPTAPTAAPASSHTPTPSAPALTGPADGSAFRDEVILTWRPVAGAAGFRVETRRADQRSWRPWPVEAGSESLRLVFSDHPDYFGETDDTYWWRVVALDQGGNAAAYSQARRWEYRPASTFPACSTLSPSATATGSPTPALTPTRSPTTSRRTLTVSPTATNTPTSPARSTPTEAPTPAPVGETPTATARPTATPTEKPSPPAPATDTPTTAPTDTPTPEKPTPPPPATDTPTPEKPPPPTPSSTALTWQEPSLSGSGLALICGIGLAGWASKRRRL